MTSYFQKEDERLRAASRRESQQRRVREKNHLKGLSSGYLNNDDEDDGYENSIAAIKADVKSKSFFIILPGFLKRRIPVWLIVLSKSLLILYKSDEKYVLFNILSTNWSNLLNKHQILS